MYEHEENSTVEDWLENQFEVIRKYIWDRIVEKQLHTKEDPSDWSKKEVSEFHFSVKSSIIERLSDERLFSIYKPIIHRTRANKNDDQLLVWAGRFSYITFKNLFIEKSTGYKTSTWDKFALYLGYDSLEHLVKTDFIKQDLPDQTMLGSPEQLDSVEHNDEHNDEHTVENEVKLKKSIFGESILWIGGASALIIFTIWYFNSNPSNFTKEDNSKFKVLLMPLAASQDYIATKTDYMSPIYDYLTADSRLNGVVVRKYKLPQGAQMPASEAEIVELALAANADLVVWGNYYETTNDQREIRIRYNLLNSYGNSALNAKGDTKFKPLKRYDQLESGYLMNDLNFILNWVQGMQHLNKFDYKNAEDIFNNLKLDSNYSNNLEVIERLADICKQTGNYKIALEYYNRLIKSSDIEPKVSDFDKGKYLLNKGVLLCELNLMDSVILVLEKGKSLLYQLNTDTTSNCFRVNAAYAVYYMRSFQRESALKHIQLASQCLNDSISEEQIRLTTNIVACSIPPLLVEEDVDLGHKHVESALKMMIKTLQVAEEHFNTNKPIIARCHHLLASCYTYQAQYEQAIFHNQKALSLQRKYLGAKNNEIIESYNYLSMLYSYQHQNDSATTYSRLAVDLMDSNGINYPTYLLNLASMLMLNADSIDKSISLIEKTIRLQEKSVQLKESHIYRIIPFIQLGKAYSLKGEYDKALTYLSTTEDRTDDFYHIDRLEILVLMSTAYFKTDHPEQAVKFYQRAKEVYEFFKVKDPVATAKYHELCALIEVE